MVGDYLDLASVEGWERGLLVLGYHSIAVPPLFHGLRGLHLTPQLLDKQLGELQSAGVGFTTLAEWKKNGSEGREVALTFDDAYRNLASNALPVLQKRGVKALVYVVASMVGKTNSWDDGKGGRRERLMDESQLREWLREGHEIGAHGLTHGDLTLLSPEEARREITGSKKVLEDLFGTPVDHFCYPYGAWNEAVRAMVREAGYATATSTWRGINTAETDIFALRRFMGRHHRPWVAALLGR